MVASVTLNRKLTERERQIKEELKSCAMLVAMIIKLASDNQSDQCYEKFRELVERLQRCTKIDQTRKDDFRETGRHHTFIAVSHKIEFLLDKAMDCARRGDVPTRMSFQAMLKTWLDRAHELTSDQDFFATIEKTIEIIKETSPRGDSSRARKAGDAVRNQGGGGAKVVENERRRFMRYESPPTFVVWIDGGFEMRTTNFSIEGMFCEPGSDRLSDGAKVTIDVMLEGDESKIVHRGAAVVTRVTDTGLALRFEQFKGPIMVFIQARKIDLAELTPV